MSDYGLSNYGLGDYVNQSGIHPANPSTGLKNSAEVVGGNEIVANAIENRRRQAVVDAAPHPRSWLTVQDAAFRTGIHPRKLLAHAHAGHLLAATDNNDPRGRVLIHRADLKAKQHQLRHRQAK